MGISGAMALIFALDRATDAAPVQHLYYFTIVFAAIRFGMIGGGLTAILAIALYHLANPHRLTWPYAEFDLLQMAVFVAVGLVSAQLATDARRLRRLAMTDDLTGLHNLRSFELRLRQIMRAARESGTPLSLLVLDVDRLKAINDVHGHLAGAEAVQTVGRLIAGHIPGGAVACRYGGDEFAIALPHCPAGDAQDVADTLRRAVQECSPVLAGVRFPPETLSISVGASSRCFDRRATTASADDDASEGLFRAADAALYVAKNGGRNRTHVA